MKLLLSLIICFICVCSHAQGPTTPSVGDVRADRLLARTLKLSYGAYIDSLLNDTTGTINKQKALLTAKATWDLIANSIVAIYKKPDTDSIYAIDKKGNIVYRFFDKDGKGFNVLDSAYKSDISRKPWAYGTKFGALGNSWVTGAFGGGTNWFSQIATYFEKSTVNYGVNGDDSRGVVRYAYQNISGNADSVIYFVDAAWVDIAGVCPYTTPYLNGVYGDNDGLKSFKKVQGLYRALFANYYLDTYSFFEDLTPLGGSFASQTTTDSTRSKASYNSKHVMKGQGVYQFVKPKNQQSLVIGFLNADGTRLTSGIINIYLRGKLYKTINTNGLNNSGQGAGGAPPSLYMGLSYDAIVMHNLPQDTCSVTVQTTTADVWLDYYGYMVPGNKTQKPIYVNSLPYLTGTVTPLAIFTGSKNKVDSFNLARRTIIDSDFYDYPVFIVDINSTIVAADYTTPTANSHLAASGNNKVANYYKQNLIPTYDRFGSDYLVEGSSGSFVTQAQLDDSTNAIRADFPASGGSGTVNSGNQYRIAYYALTGTAINEASAITANRGLISDANGVPTHSTVTATEFSYLSGATSNLQTQINSWVGLPSQTGNSGKYLTTNGTTASWATVSAGDVYLANNQTFTGTNQFNKNVTIGQSSYTAGMPTQVIINYDGSGGYGTRGIMLNDKWSGGTGVMQLIGGSSTFYFTNGSGTAAKISSAGYQNGATGNSIDFGGSGVNVNGDRFAIGGITYTSAIFQIASTTKYSIPYPPMTNTQKGSLTSLTAGATVYCTDCTADDASTGVVQTYNGTTWKNHW